MEIDCLNHSICVKEHFGCKNICVQHLGPISAGGIVGAMFLLREAARLKGVKTLDNLLAFLGEYQVKFRSVDFEMLFIAELTHLRYYPISDFDTLCFKCIDFTNIIQKPTMFEVGHWRRTPRGPFPKTHR